MALVDRWRAARMRDPVEGVFVVAAVRLIARTAGWFEAYDVDGVVTGPGVEPTPLHRGSVMVRLPDALIAGQRFPALVDRADPKRCVIRFPSTRTAATSPAAGAAAAEDLARRMREEGPDGRG